MITIVMAATARRMRTQTATAQCSFLLPGCWLVAACSASLLGELASPTSSAWKVLLLASRLVVVLPFRGFTTFVLPAVALVDVAVLMMVTSD